MDGKPACNGFVGEVTITCWSPLVRSNQVDLDSACSGSSSNIHGVYFWTSIKWTSHSSTGQSFLTLSNQSIHIPYSLSYHGFHSQHRQIACFTKNICIIGSAWWIDCSPTLLGKHWVVVWWCLMMVRNGQWWRYLRCKRYVTNIV